MAIRGDTKNPLNEQFKGFFVYFRIAPHHHKSKNVSVAS